MKIKILCATAIALVIRQAVAAESELQFNPAFLNGERANSADLAWVNAGSALPPGEYGGKHERTVQHTEEKRIFTCQIAINFVRYANHFFLNILFLDGNSKLLVFYLYGIHNRSF